MNYKLSLALISFVACVLSAQQRATVTSGDIKQAPLSGDLRIDLLGEHGLLADSITTLQLKDLPGYKSPLKAALFSAVIPGTGQAYAERYWQGIAFFGAEVGLWIVYATYQSKGDRQTDDFQTFADGHWSVVRYAQWITTNIGQLNPNANTSGIITSNDPSIPPWQRVDWSRLNDCENQIMEVTGNGFTHNLPVRPSQQYYELVGKYPQFLGGWDDGFSRSPADVVASNVSPNFLDYRDQRTRANSLYAIASTATYVLVANHVFSALEAAWSAAVNNSNLKMGATLEPVTRGDGWVEFIPTAKIQFHF